MATQVNAGADLKRSDLYLVNPFEIEVLEANRGRTTPPSEEDILNLAASIFDHGQQQPVQCRRVAGNRLQLTMGYSRMAGFRLIREGFTGTDGVERIDPEMKIKVVVADTNDEKALTNNIIENRHRNQTTAIDDAVNQNLLRDRYGYDDEKIAGLYLCSVATVQRMQLLLRLEQKEQDLVHEGKLSVNAALDVLELPAEKRAEVLEKATVKETGKVKAAEVKAQVRDHHLSDDKGGKRDPANAGPPPKTERKKPGEAAVEPEAPAKAEKAAKPAKGAVVAAKLKARTVKEIKDFLRIQGSYDTGNRAKFCRILNKWVEGARTNEQLEITLQRVFGEIAEEETKESD